MIRGGRGRDLLEGGHGGDLLAGNDGYDVCAGQKPRRDGRSRGDIANRTCEAISSAIHGDS